MEKVKITQVKSKNGATARQIATLQSLGLRRINHTVEREVNDVTKGMIEKVRHLIVIEEIKVKETKPRAPRAKKAVVEAAPVAEEQVQISEEQAPSPETEETTA